MILYFSTEKVVRVCAKCRQLKGETFHTGVLQVG